MQDMAAIEVFQGESPRLEENRKIGHFMLEGLNASSGCDGRIHVRFELSLDGTLKVTAIESKSGISQRLAIVDALSTMKNAAGAAERLGRLSGFSSSVAATVAHHTDRGGASDPAPAGREASTSPPWGGRESLRADSRKPSLQGGRQAFREPPPGARAASQPAYESLAGREMVAEVPLNGLSICPGINDCLE